MQRLSIHRAFLVVGLGAVVALGTFALSDHDQRPGVVVAKHSYEPPVGPPSAPPSVGPAQIGNTATAAPAPNSIPETTKAVPSLKSK